MRSLLGAVFLACSWCWCIGMFFPVLMVRDFGIWGWVAFLVPNCLGAMMVGLVHRRAGSALATATRHAPAARGFSIVTILFHVSFLSWFVPGFVRLGGIPAWTMLGVALVVVALALWAGAAWTTRRAWMIGGACVFAASMALGWAAWSTGPTIALPDAPGRFGTLSLAAFAPAVALGFLTCPHLDLTFLRLRAELSNGGMPPACAGGSQEHAERAGTLAFVLGFAVFFPALMVLTLLYAGALARGAVSYYIVAHIAAQAWFTMAAHFREVLGKKAMASSPPLPLPQGGDSAIASPMSVRGVTPIVITVVLVSVVSFMATTDVFPGLGRGLAGISTEFLYKSFITFYGVIFPAYVWIVMVPRTRGGTRWTPRVLMWGAIGAAMPFAWMGYIREQWLLTLGIPAVILLAPVVGSWSRRL